MKIVIKRLELVNFKGLTCSFDFGHDNSIIAGNGKGKTRLFDAWNWLNTGKDQDFNSLGDSVACKNDKGEYNKGIVTSVLSFLDIDGSKVKLEKKFYFKFGKKTEKHTNTYEYFVDGILKKEKDFKELLNSLYSEQNFKILSSFKYLYSKEVNQKKRSEIFSSFTSGIKISDFLGNAKYEEIKKVAADNDLNDLEKSFRKDLSGCEGEELKIQGAMNEASLKVKDLVKPKKALKEIDAKNDIIDFYHSEIKKDAEASKVAVENLKTGIIEDEKTKAKEDRNLRERERSLELKQDDLQHSKNLLNTLQKELTEADKTNTIVNSEIKKLNAERKKEINLYQQTKASIFHAEFTENCPACGQKLPVEQVENAYNTNKQNALKTFEKSCMDLFNNAKRKEIELIDKKVLQERIVKGNLKVADYGKDIKEFDKLKVLEVELTEDLRISLDLKNKDLEKLLSASINKKYFQEIEENKTDIESLEDDVKEFNDSIEALKRIEELRLELKEKTQQKLNFKRKLSLVADLRSKYIKACEMPLNKLLAPMQVKLFKEQSNGEFKSCFDLLCVDDSKNLVEFSELSTGKKIIAGIKLIKVLSDDLGIELPLFIDNAEGVDDITNLDTQVVKLYEMPFSDLKMK